MYGAENLSEYSPGSGERFSKILSSKFLEKSRKINVFYVGPSDFPFWIFPRIPIQTARPHACIIGGDGATAMRAAWRTPIVAMLQMENPGLGSYGKPLGIFGGASMVKAFAGCHFMEALFGNQKI